MYPKFKDVLLEFIKNDPNQTVGLFQLGLMHLYGTTYPQDTVKGLSLIKEAAKSYPFAYTFLGVAYLEGDNVERDVEKGIKYLEKAIKLNDDKALIHLSSVYLNSSYVPHNLRKAIRLLTKAVERNNPEAMLHLGIIYLGTSYIASDFQKAYDLLHKSSILGNANASAFLGLMYENGDGITQDKRKAFKYYLKATSGNSSIAHFFLGRQYLKGEPVKANIYEAISHFSLAAEAGHIEAINKLVEIYLDKSLTVYDPQIGLTYVNDLFNNKEPSGYYLMGKFLIEGELYPQNIKRGLKYLRLSNSVESYLYLGKLYQYGIHTNYNIYLALLYFLKGSELGSSNCMIFAAELILDEKIEADYLSLIKYAVKLKNADAYYLLGRCYLDGKGVKQNNKKAFTLFQQASANDSAKGTRLLGMAYLYGIGIKKDINKAIHYLKIAVALKDYLSALLIGKVLTENYNDKVNIDHAKKYFSIAANNQIRDAYYYLSLLVDKDKVIPLLKKGISLGSEVAKEAYLKYIDK